MKPKPAISIKDSNNKLVYGINTNMPNRLIIGAVCFDVAENKIKFSMLGSRTRWEVTMYLLTCIKIIWTNKRHTS